MIPQTPRPTSAGCGMSMRSQGRKLEIIERRYAAGLRDGGSFRIC